MKRLALLLLLPTSLLAQVAAPPVSLSNWPTANTALTLADPAAPNQVAGWDNTAKKWVWVTAGAGGGGNVSNSGTPTAGQLAQWTSSTVIKGVTLSGSGTLTASIDTSGVLSLSTIPNTSLANSAITIAGTSTSLGGTISRDTIMGVSSNGLVQRTAANTYSVAVIGTDVQAEDAQLDSLAALTYTSNALKVIRVNAGATGFELATVGGSGTVTNSGGNLTANSVVLGAGSADTKVVSSITTDGSSVLNLGNNGTNAGLKLYDAANVATTLNSSGTVARTVTLPNATTTLVGVDTTDTLLNKTLRDGQLGDSTSSGFTMRNAGNVLTTVLPSSAVAATTITLPSNTTTLVGTDTTDTLLNKTLTSSSHVDSSGLLFWSTGNVAITLKRGGGSGNAFTNTLPEKTTTLVGTDTTDSLTNKTFDNSNVVDSSGLKFNSTGNAAVTLKRGGASGSTFTVTLPEATSTLTTQADNLGVFAASTSAAIGVGSIELGAASDTTIARSAAGAIMVEGVVVPTISSTNTLTNKRINPRVDSSTSAGATTWAPNGDTTDVFELAGALTAAVTTISNPSGTPVEGQQLMFRIKSDGSAHALTWSGSQWRASTASGAPALPGTTTASKNLYLGFQWNSTDSKWDLLAVQDGF